MKDMKDPIQGTLDAVRELEIRIDNAKAIMGREIERLRNERDAALGRVVKLEKARRDGEQEVQALRESIAAIRAGRDKERADWSRLLQDERLALHNTIVGLRGDLENAQRRYERMTEESLARVADLEKEGKQDVQALRESIAAVRFQRDKALARVEELEREVASLRSPRQSVEGEVSIQFGPMNVCCCSARQMARNECASALFRVLHPNKEPHQQGTYVFNTALAEVIEEINALRKDRETLNWVRGVVEVKP